MARVALAAIALGAQLVAAGGGSTAPFSASAARVTANELRWSYRPGCPVAPAQLRQLRLFYIGFDGHTHRGSLIVNAELVPAVKQIFARLYAARFPIRRMEPIDAYDGNDYRSMAADNTSGFNCRYAVAAGPKHWSAHAYGDAIDINPLENPYLMAGNVYPPAGRRYLNRADVRPGMATLGGTLNAAFAAAGWQWGGRWTNSPDYQHFSSTGG